MAILKSSVKLIIKESARYAYAGPVLTLGIPEIYASYEELKSWFPMLSQAQCPIGERDVEVTTNKIGQKFGWVTAKSFFESLKFSKMVSVDIPGCEHAPDLVHDLNQPLPLEYQNRFGLVFDPGTVEHVFDLRTVLTSIVRALVVGGTVIHQVPVYSYNGGYVSINPNLLNDFYSSNGFGELKTYIIMWDRYHSFTGKHRVYEYDFATLGYRHALSDYDQCRYSPHMLFFAKKMKEIPTVVIPLQYEGHYVEGIGGASTDRPEPTGIRKLLHALRLLAYQKLPFSMAFYLEAWAARHWVLMITRRRSFKF